MECLVCSNFILDFNLIFNFLSSFACTTSVLKSQSWCMYWSRNMHVMTCWMRRHELPIRMAGSSLSTELPLWGTDTYGDVWIEGSVQYTPQKESRVTRYYYRFQNQRGVVEGGGEERKPSVHVSREQEIGRGVASTYYICHGWGRGHSLFVSLSVYFKRCPGKSKTWTYGQHPKLKSLSNCPDSGCEWDYHTRNA